MTVTSSNINQFPKFFHRLKVFKFLTKPITPYVCCCSSSGSCKLHCVRWDVFSGTQCRLPCEGGVYLVCLTDDSGPRGVKQCDQASVGVEAFSIFAFSVSLSAPEFVAKFTWRFSKSFSVHRQIWGLV